MRALEMFVGFVICGLWIQHYVVRNLWPEFYERWLAADREMRKPMFFVLKKCVTPTTIRAAIKFLKW